MILETLIIVAVIVVLLLLFVLLIIKGNVITEKLKIFKLKFLLSLKKDEEAKKYALKIVDKYPRNHVAHRILAELYEKEGKINLALDEYIRTVELNEKDFEMHYKVALLLQQTNRNEDAVIMLQDLLRMKPDYLDATLLLGNILYEEERFKEAISLYTTALRYHPTEYELYYDMGMAFTRLNDFQKAKEYYQRAAILNSYLYNGQYNLALIAMIQGELDTAEKHLQKALQQEELEPIGYFYLALIALLKDEKEKAVNYINLALELDKKIEKKIAEQPLFLPIQDKIRVPNEPSRKINITLSKKELKTNEYLEEMYNLVDSLNSGNIVKDEEVKMEEIQLENENEKER